MGLGTLDILARWLHIIGVLVWMGHNYANVIQTPTFKPPRLDAAADVFAAATKREHAIFRHASLVTLVTGLYMLWYRGMLIDTLALTGPFVALGLGVWIGTLMVANLWLVLWPHQRIVLGYVQAPVEQRLRCSRITFLSSRTNTILSFPALFLMIAGSHGGFLFG